MRYVCLLILALLPRPADACSIPYIPMFQIFDRAAIVAQSRVAQDNGKVVLRVIHAFKGSPGNEIRLDHKIRGPHSSCDPHLKGRSVGIVYLTKDLRFAAAYDSFPKATKALVAAISAYAKATDAKSRAAVLVDLMIGGGEHRIVYDAGLSLADDPAALVEVTDADRDRLRALKVDADSYVSVVLERIGPVAEKPEALAKIIETGKAKSAASAFERCERAHRKRLGDIRVTRAAATEGGDWKRHAEACRTGVSLD